MLLNIYAGKWLLCYQLRRHYFRVASWWEHIWHFEDLPFWSCLLLDVRPRPAQSILPFFTSTSRRSSWCEARVGGHVPAADGVREISIHSIFWEDLHAGAVWPRSYNYQARAPPLPASRVHYISFWLLVALRRPRWERRGGRGGSQT